ncbi:hypothetical protein GLUCOINTEAF2_0204064 [Komagataeibacter intermedius AF2]|uniref:Uncharacterized protein n=1 Tax=Komagataeibacter intermedius AF2 TaxID=1458464 RepID=A0A0N1FA61_9PROT|nr:hypothetical protein GLUCOINTEAF2_0204064 [Komagataeibacter intermedius AF2]
MRVAHPGQHRCDRAGKADSTIPKDAVGVVAGRLTKLADQHFTDGVGIAGRKRIERIGLADAACGQKVEIENLVVQPEAAGKRQHIAVDRVVTLAVDQDKPGSVRKRIGQQGDGGCRFAGTCCAWYGGVLASRVG